jgi:hypothetical protein
MIMHKLFSDNIGLYQWHLKGNEFIKKYIVNFESIRS